MTVQPTVCTDLVVRPLHDLLHQSHPLPPDLLLGGIQLVDHSLTDQAAEEQHTTTILRGVDKVSTSYAYITVQAPSAADTPVTHSQTNIT